MKKVTAIITMFIIATSMIAPTVAIGASTSDSPMSKYEAASIVMDSINNKTYKSVVILGNTEEYVAAYLEDIAEQIDNLTGYIYKIKATYNKDEYPLRLNIEVSNNDEEKSKVSTIDASASLIAKQAKERYKDKIKQLAYVNDTLAGICDYDLKSSENVESASDMAWSAYGCLTLGKAVCAGYTNALTVIVEKLDIPIIEIIGTSPTGIRHTWNKVYLGETWLNIDVTSNDPVWINKPTDKEREQVLRKFFLVTDKELESKGYVWDTNEVEITKIIKYPNIVDIQAKEIEKLRILTGTQNGLELDRELTRSELAIVLVRLEGKAKEVANNKDYYRTKCLFDDVEDWAKPYVGYCVENGLLHGINNSEYGGNRVVSKRDFATVLLRTLRVHSNTYTWNTAVDKCISIGIIPYSRSNGMRNGIAYRSDVVDGIYKALDIEIKGDTSIRNRVINDR